MIDIKNEYIHFLKTVIFYHKQGQRTEIETKKNEYGYCYMILKDDLEMTLKQSCSILLSILMKVAQFEIYLNSRF